MEHDKYMLRCLELAAKALGDTFPNPVVGCVIVHDGKIIGEGYHKKAGEPHAEINAINAVANPELLREATVYVSLEPCAHFGKTPPCAQNLAKIGVKRVVIGTLDSHNKVNGKGKKILKNAGIDVVSGILEKECRQINKRFFTFHQKKRPFVILKWAQSADGFIDKDYLPHNISNSLVNQFTHKMRAQEHAILIGSNTARTDNPSLTVRHIEGKNPVRILVDPALKTVPYAKIFNDEAKTIIINNEKAYVHGHLNYIQADCISVEKILEILYESQIQSVIVEGGKFTLDKFIESGIWDQAVIIKNPTLFLKNGMKAPTLTSTMTKKIICRDNIIEFRTNESF